MSDPRDEYKLRANQLSAESQLPEAACYASVSFLGGTAGEYLISDETLALLIAVANGLLPLTELPRNLRIEP